VLSQYGGPQEKTTFSRAGHPRPLAYEFIFNKSRRRT